MGDLWSCPGRSNTRTNTPPSLEFHYEYTIERNLHGYKGDLPGEAPKR